MHGPHLADKVGVLGRQVGGEIGQLARCGGYARRNAPERDQIQDGQFRRTNILAGACLDPSVPSIEPASSENTSSFG